MNWLHTGLILLAAFVVVFAQVTFDSFRDLTGAQVDLLPSLMVYASLSCSIPTVAILAFASGLWYDSLSANPLGISMLPLFAIGFIIQQYRGLILREERYAQIVIGLAASTGAPLGTLLLLLNLDPPPLIGGRTLWQVAVMGAVGGLVTPLWFKLLDRAMGALSYRPWEEFTFRHDREIKRGRL